MAITKTVFKVGDFVSWMKAGELQLAPKFQRRSVWKPGAKSFLVDTVIRSLPIPIVFLRDRVSVGSITSTREVVDGQQRLRTLLGFMDSKLIKDYDPDKDDFAISATHNRAFAGKQFKDLSSEAKQAIVGYEVPVHVFSSDTEDRDVLQIFARLNATGVRVNDQELRNADWYGAFKTLSYTVAYQHLASWTEWDVFSDTDISRMREVEEVSDLIIAMHEGVHGKSQKKLDKYYKDFDADYKQGKEVVRRFNYVMSALDASIGSSLAKSEFSRHSLFHCLFLAAYHMSYGLGSPLKSTKPSRLPERFAARIQALSNKLKSDNLPEDLAKSLRGATGDSGTRLLRTNFILEEFGVAIKKRD